MSIFSLTSNSARQKFLWWRIQSEWQWNQARCINYVTLSHFCGWALLACVSGANHLAKPLGKEARARIISRAAYARLRVCVCMCVILSALLKSQSVLTTNWMRSLAAVVLPRQRAAKKQPRSLHQQNQLGELINFMPSRTQQLQTSLIPSRAPTKSCNEA